MINKEKLGIYTLNRGNDEIFWSIHHYKDEYVVSWGFVGQQPKGQKIINEISVEKQIENKLNHGYSHKYQEIINFNELLQFDLKTKTENIKKIKI